MKKLVLFIILIVLIPYVFAEEVSIRFVRNEFGKSILLNLYSLDKSNDIGSIDFDYYRINFTRQLTNGEIENVTQVFPLQAGQIRRLFNVTNSLWIEKNHNGVRTEEELVTDGSKLIAGTLYYPKEGEIGNIMAEGKNIYINNALLNLSQRKIILYNKGYFKVFDPETRAYYFYEADSRSSVDMKIGYSYNNINSFEINAPNTIIKIYCYSKASEVDDFCTYTENFLDQGNFPLKVLDFTYISGIFNYTRKEQIPFTNKTNETNKYIVAGYKVPLTKNFIYFNYFSLRTQSIIFLLGGKADEKFFCYGKINNKEYYSLSKNCEFKSISQGQKEVGITTEIQTANVQILRPAYIGELNKIKELLKG